MEKNLNRIYSEEKRRKFHNGVAGFGAAAAVVAGGIFLGMHTPVLAENAPRLLENIPILRGIFVDMQDDFAYSGDYEYVGEALPDMYTETVNGVTVTLSEVYCNDYGLYASFIMESEDIIPDMDILNELDIIATGNFNFFDSGSWDGASVLSGRCSEGKRIDDHTVMGVVRFDLMRMRGWDSDSRIPENFTLDLSVMDITLWEKGNGVDNYQTYHGPWSFALNVKKDNSGLQVIEGGVNEAGVGFEKIEKERFEIVMFDKQPVLTFEEALESHDGYVPIMLDADGEWMQTEGESMVINTVAIGDHDISHVDVFMISYNTFFDELKPLYWNSHEDGTFDGEAFRELLLEKCAYHQEIVFEE